MKSFNILVTHPISGNKLIDIKINIDADEKTNNLYSNWQKQIVATINKTFNLTCTDKDITQFKYYVLGFAEQGVVVSDVNSSIPVASFNNATVLTLQVSKEVMRSICDKIMTTHPITSWRPEIVAHWFRRLGQGENPADQTKTNPLAVVPFQDGDQKLLRADKTLSAEALEQIASKVEEAELALTQEKAHKTAAKDETSIDINQFSGANLVTCAMKIKADQDYYGDKCLELLKSVKGLSFFSILDIVLQLAYTDPFIIKFLNFQQLSLEEKLAQQMSRPSFHLKTLPQVPAKEEDLPAYNKNPSPNSLLFTHWSENFIISGKEGQPNGRNWVNLKLGPFYIAYCPGGKSSFQAAMYLLNRDNKTAKCIFHNEHERYSNLFDFSDLFPFELGSFYSASTVSLAPSNPMQQAANELRKEMIDFIQAVAGNKGLYVYKTGAGYLPVSEVTHSKDLVPIANYEGFIARLKLMQNVLEQPLASATVKYVHFQRKAKKKSLQTLNANAVTVLAPLAGFDAKATNSSTALVSLANAAASQAALIVSAAGPVINVTKKKEDASRTMSNNAAVDPAHIDAAHITVFRSRK